MAQRKNNYYVEKVKKIDKSAILPGAWDFIMKIKEKGILVAIGSSSKNAKLILTQTGCVDLFDAIADGNDIVKSKPAPDVFLIAAEKLGLKPSECVVVEDADAGIEAALAAGMDVIAVGYAKTNVKATYSANDLQEAQDIEFNV
jgi:beta-phosphoglucomutase